MYQKLMQQALIASKNSHSPYSNFKVGCALLTKTGKIFLGCNIENASFSATCCAERVAFFKAISEGETNFQALALVGGKNGVFSEPCIPCGVCRQVMSEFCNPNFELVIGTPENFKIYKLKDLFPLAFSKKNLT